MKRPQEEELLKFYEYMQLNSPTKEELIYKKFGKDLTEYTKTVIAKYLNCPVDYNKDKKVFVKGYHIEQEIRKLKESVALSNQVTTNSHQYRLNKSLFVLFWIQAITLVYASLENPLNKFLSETLKIEIFFMFSIAMAIFFIRIIYHK